MVIAPPTSKCFSQGKMWCICEFMPVMIGWWLMTIGRLTETTAGCVEPLSKTISDTAQVCCWRSENIFQDFSGGVSPSTKWSFPDWSCFHIYLAWSLILKDSSVKLDTMLCMVSPDQLFFFTDFSCLKVEWLQNCYKYPMTDPWCWYICKHKGGIWMGSMLPYIAYMDPVGMIMIMIYDILWICW